MSFLVLASHLSLNLASSFWILVLIWQHFSIFYCTKSLKHLPTVSKKLLTAPSLLLSSYACHITSLGLAELHNNLHLLHSICLDSTMSPYNRIFSTSFTLLPLSNFHLKASLPRVIVIASSIIILIGWVSPKPFPLSPFLISNVKSSNRSFDLALLSPLLLKVRNNLFS